MRIVTWNVNSVKVRLERLLAFLDRHAPDVVCLQELKTTDDAFPREPIEAAGYHAVTHGQKTYNGVAILSRSEPTAVTRDLDDDPADDAARAIFADVDGVTVGSLYVPNGQTVGSDAYDYKLAWYARLLERLRTHHDPARPLVLGADYNCARDDLDVNNPERWAPSVLCDPAVRAAFASLLDWGLVDVFREHHPDGKVYSWWDYRRLGFPKNDGLRIDALLATAPLAARCTGAFVDRDERKGKQPSDHAPVVADFGG